MTQNADFGHSQDSSADQANSEAMIGVLDNVKGMLLGMPSQQNNSN